jgi:hypothetical protein
MSDITARAPTDIPRTHSPADAKTCVAPKVAVMQNPRLPAVPPKYKLLVGVGAQGARLGEVTAE